MIRRGEERWLECVLQQEREREKGVITWQEIDGSKARVKLSAE